MARTLECQRCHVTYEGHGNSHYCPACRDKAHLEACREAYQRQQKKGIIDLKPRKCWDCGEILGTTDPEIIRCARCQAEHDNREIIDRRKKFAIQRELMLLADDNVDAFCSKILEMKLELDPSTFDWLIVSMMSTYSMKLILNRISPLDNEKIYKAVYGE